MNEGVAVIYGDGICEKKKARKNPKYYQSVR